MKCVTKNVLHIVGDADELAIALIEARSAILARIDAHRHTCANDPDCQRAANLLAALSTAVISRCKVVIEVKDEA